MAACLQLSKCPDSCSRFFVSPSSSQALKHIDVSALAARVRGNATLWDADAQKSTNALLAGRESNAAHFKPGCSTAQLARAAAARPNDDATCSPMICIRYMCFVLIGSAFIPGACHHSATGVFGPKRRAVLLHALVERLEGPRRGAGHYLRYVLLDRAYSGRLPTPAAATLSPAVFSSPLRPRVLVQPVIAEVLSWYGIPKAEYDSHLMRVQFARMASPPRPSTRSPCRE